jgi:hypothetical protein
VQISSPAPAGPEVVFEVRVAARNFGDAGDGFRAERRTSEVGVDDDAGRIDDRLERERGVLAQAVRGITLDGRDHVAGHLSTRQPVAHPVGRRP